MKAGRIAWSIVGLLPLSDAVRALKPIETSARLLGKLPRSRPGSLRPCWTSGRRTRTVSGAGANGSEIAIEADHVECTKCTRRKRQ